MQIGNLNVNVNSIVNKVRDQIEQYRGSEIEKKVKEATSSANWGVTGQVKEDIARATYDYTGYSEVIRRISTSFSRFRIGCLTRAYLSGHGHPVETDGGKRQELENGLQVVRPARILA